MSTSLVRQPAMTPRNAPFCHEGRVRTERRRASAEKATEDETARLPAIFHQRYGGAAMKLTIWTTRRLRSLVWPLYSNQIVASASAGGKISHNREYPRRHNTTSYGVEFFLPSSLYASLPTSRRLLLLLLLSPQVRLLLPVLHLLL